MFVKAEGPSGRAKIHSDDPKHALGLPQYLRTIGHDAGIEDTNGNEIDEKALKIGPQPRTQRNGRTQGNQCGEPRTEEGRQLILITTDRHSSFDRIIAHIPWKGQVLNQVSAWWFEQTKAIVSNQVLEVPDPNVMVVRKYKIVPVEAVMRGYLTGVTDTSI